MGGAGGYGDVVERDPERVAEDVRVDLITAEVAHRIYGVALDPETGRVDRKATERRRRSMRRARLAKGLSFNRFIEDWCKKRPPQEVTAFYGAWPEPRVPDYDKPFWGLYR